MSFFQTILNAIQRFTRLRLGNVLSNQDFQNFPDLIGVLLKRLQELVTIAVNFPSRVKMETKEITEIFANQNPKIFAPHKDALEEILVQETNTKDRAAIYDLSKLVNSLTQKVD